MIGNVVAGTLSSGFVAPFVPTSISNCYLWLDSTDTASFTYSSGAVVSQWNDLSGNNYHATQATVAQQPIRVTSPDIGVDFDGSNDVLSTNASFNGSAFTTFIVAKGYVAGTTILGGGPGGDDFYFPYIQTTILYWQILSAYGTATVTYPAGLAELEIRYDGSGSTNADKMKGRFDGSERTLSFTGTMPSTLARSGQATAIGGYNLTPVLAYDGVISEVLVYNKVLDNTELTKVRDYLSTKWSITA